MNLVGKAGVIPQAVDDEWQVSGAGIFHSYRCQDFLEPQFIDILFDQVGQSYMSRPRSRASIRPMPRFKSLSRSFRARSMSSRSLRQPGDHLFGSWIHRRESLPTRRSYPFAIDKAFGVPDFGFRRACTAVAIACSPRELDERSR